MNIVFYTSGVAGSGRLVRGIAVANALGRAGIPCDFTILSSSSFAELAERSGVKHRYVPKENEEALSEAACRDSELYKALGELKPDILIVDLLWFTLQHFIDELPCRKIFLCHQVIEDFFHIRELSLRFRPEQYDEVIAIEPFVSDVVFRGIHPLILKNRDEILSRKEALERLELSGKDRNILFAVNARPGDFERLKKKYAPLANRRRKITYSTNYKGGLFPVIDYFNAFDMVICLAGYNQFWECLYFRKEAVFETIPLNFSSMDRRIRECGRMRIRTNGADELVKIMC